MCWSKEVKPRPSVYTARCVAPAFRPRHALLDPTVRAGVVQGNRPFYTHI